MVKLLSSAMRRKFFNWRGFTGESILDDGTRACSQLSDVCERGIGLPGQGTSDAVGLFPIRSEQRGHGGPMARSLRVVVKCGVRFVARFVNGMTIDLTSLRAAIRI